MIVRLQNLSTRNLSPVDCEAVAELMNICDDAEAGSEAYTGEKIQQRWRTARFCLLNDAWGIVTKTEQVVGYADVQCDLEAREKYYTVTVRVHPQYRGRGLGTLLVRLLEERTRQILISNSSERALTLRTTLRSQDMQGRNLLEREGYTPVHHFWRLLIDVEALAAQAQAVSVPMKQFQLDLVIDDEALPDDDMLHQRLKGYVACQHVVYEKVLHPASIQEMKLCAPRAAL